MSNLGLQVTHWLETQQSCMKWYDHFLLKGVPAAVVRHNGHFALFRKGPVRRKNDRRGYIEKDAPVYVTMECENTPLSGGSSRNVGPKIMLSCNGYDKEVGNETVVP